MGVIPIYKQWAAHPQTAVCSACAVRGEALFGVLDEAGLERIHAHITSQALEADEPVYRRGGAAGAVYTLRSGLVRFERYNERGERRIVRLAGRGDFIGQEALLQRAYADDAVACTPVELCRIPASLVNELILNDIQVQRELLRRWQQALDDSEAWLSELAAGTARQRMLALLQRLAEHAGPGAFIWLPRREEMGAMLDMTLETASRQVSQLRREGVLEFVSPRRTRLHLPALEAALYAEIDGQPCALQPDRRAAL